MSWKSAGEDLEVTREEVLDHIIIIIIVIAAILLN